MTSGSSSVATAGGLSKDVRDGVLAGLFAYVAWGLMPAYFKFMAHVPPAEMVAHRIVWSVPFGALIIGMRRQWGDVFTALSQPRTLGLLLITATLITVNWVVYVWAVQAGQVFQASLGYYITPLFYVLVGVVFFKDPFRRLQKLAIASATIAVSLLLIFGGQVPVVAMVLAVSFTTYGVIRKTVNIGAMPGLFIETSVLVVPALFYMYWLHQSGALVFSFGDAGEVASFLVSGPVTVLPLLMFAVAAKRLTLSTIGFMQFIGPTMQFLLGVYYGEELTPAYAACFLLIWMAAALYGYDAWAITRKQRAILKSS